MAIITVKNTDPSGQDSLPWAVDHANNHPDTTIKFGMKFGPNGATIELSGGELAITRSMTIIGPPWSKITNKPVLRIKGKGLSRIFAISSDAEGEVTISHLEIADGLAPSNDTDFPCLGGGILNQGILTLKHVVLSNNKAVGNAPS